MLVSRRVPGLVDKFDPSRRASRDVDKENAENARRGDCVSLPLQQRTLCDVDHSSKASACGGADSRIPLRRVSAGNKQRDATQSGELSSVPKLNLGLLRRAMESIPASSPASAKKGNEHSFLSHSSVDSGNDFSSQAEHMDDEELKFILRRQYKKVVFSFVFCSGCREIERDMSDVLGHVLATVCLQFESSSLATSPALCSYDLNLFHETMLGRPTAASWSLQLRHRARQRQRPA